MNRMKTALIAAAVSALLSACGGGGESTTTAPQPTVPPVQAPAPGPAITPADLQTSVPTLTYGAASVEHAFVSDLNQFRVAIGLGLLAQNAMLDRAAQNHLQYVLRNSAQYGGLVNMRTNDPISGRSMFHIESAAYPLFTGAQEVDRAQFAGYSGKYVGEELAFAGGKGGRTAFASLASTIYHRAGLMMEGLRDVGIAAGADASQTFVLEMGYRSPQANASNFLGVYPANGQTGVGLHTGVESPNPFPDLSTSTDDFPMKTGYPVTVVVKEGVEIAVQTFTLTEAGSTTPMPGRVMTKANDPNRYLGANVAFFVAASRLKPNMTYTASFVGTANGVGVARTWAFTTGA